MDYPNDLSANYEEMKIRKSEKLIFDEFTEKYLGNLTLNEIKKMIEENRDKEPIMNDYYNNQLINCDNTNDNYYSNSKLMDQLLKSKSSEEALYYYQNDFQK